MKKNFLILLSCFFTLIITGTSNAETTMSQEGQYIFNSLGFYLGGVLVAFMAAGFCMLESGLVTTKSVSTIAAKNIGKFAICSIVFFLVGYNLAYGIPEGGYIGSFSVWTDTSNPETGYSGYSDFSWEEAWNRGIAPVKTFMAKQIEAAGNAESIAVFYKYVPEYSEAAPTSAQDVPINVLLPAFMVSELKIAFLLGFQIFLPFLVLDLVVSSVTVSTGMLMLPPTMVSFPLKLILFVLVDGWNLVVGMLLQSFIPMT